MYAEAVTSSRCYIGRPSDRSVDIVSLLIRELVRFGDYLILSVMLLLMHRRN